MDLGHLQNLKITIFEVIFPWRIQSRTLKPLAVTCAKTNKAGFKWYFLWPFMFFRLNFKKNLLAKSKCMRKYFASVSADSLCGIVGRPCNMTILLGKKMRIKQSLLLYKWITIKLLVRDDNMCLFIVKI